MVPGLLGWYAEGQSWGKSVPGFSMEGGPDAAPEGPDASFLRIPVSQNPIRIWGLFSIGDNTGPFYDSSEYSTSPHIGLPQNRSTCFGKLPQDCWT